MSELKACPFCGEQLNQQENQCVWDSEQFYEHPKVNNCHLSELMFSEQFWNTRPIEDELKAELKATDALLKEATETIGAVIACCTYNSNDDAKIGIYGIDQKAFTRIDQFITHYNDTVSAGKVSVDVKRDLSDAEIEELGAQEAEKRGEK